MNHHTDSIPNTDAAFEYLFRFAPPIQVLGRDHELKCVLDRIKMPAMPLLASNKQQREQMSMTKWRKFIKDIKDAIEQEKSKPFFVPLYEVEIPLEGQEPDVGEAMTIEQFEKLCHE